MSSRKASELLAALLKNGDLRDAPRHAARLLMQGIVVPMNILALLALLWMKAGVSSVVVVLGFLPLILVTVFFFVSSLFLPRLRIVSPVRSGFLYFRVSCEC
jgi:hypothetical protein